MSDSTQLSLKLAAALGAVWIVLAGPVTFAGGMSGLEGLSYAALLCLLPRLFQHALALFVASDPHPLIELLIGMLARMGLILGGTIVICLARPDLRAAGFFVGLGLCYVVTLLVETRHSVQATRRSQPPVTGTVLGG